MVVFPSLSSCFNCVLGPLNPLISGLMEDLLVQNNVLYSDTFKLKHINSQHFKIKIREIC